MTLTQEDLNTLRILLREELATKDEHAELRSDMNQRFDVATTQLDGISKQVETLGQEYEALKHQVKKLEAA